GFTATLALRAPPRLALGDQRCRSVYAAVNTATLIAETTFLDSPTAMLCDRVPRWKIGAHDSPSRVQRLIAEDTRVAESMQHRGIREERQLLPTPADRTTLELAQGGHVTRAEKSLNRV